jgi:tRNA(Ile)-lysidine synthase
MNLLANFNKLDELIEPRDKQPTIWVAYSGGLDSTVLLHLAKQWAEENGSSLAFEPKIKAIHIHHGLSENADDWLQHAEQQCQQLNIELIAEKVLLGDAGDGFELAARKARYQVFDKRLAEDDILLQGHHLDDQAETFFMRALRGSGLKGLSSIPAQRLLSQQHSATILRPLLKVHKQELEAYAQQQALSWVEDESNSDVQYERNWWRNELLPKVWQRYGVGKKKSLDRSIENLTADQALLEHFLDQLLASDQCSELPNFLQGFTSFSLPVLESLPQQFHGAVIRHWLAKEGAEFSKAQLDTILRDMIHCDLDADPEIQLGQYQLRRYRQHLFLLAEDEFEALSIPKFAGLSELEGYRIRYWQDGDVVKPFGRPSKKLKKYWQDYGVPSWLRQYWPLVVDEQDNIVCVPGLFNCEQIGMAKPLLFKYEE